MLFRTYEIELINMFLTFIY